MTITTTVRVTRALLIAGLFMAAPWAAAQDGAEEAPAPKRPKFKFLRYQEDWSALADWTPDQLDDPWDSIKYVPLNDDGSTWASFGGSARLRLENWNGFAFGAPSDDNDTFLLWRLLLHADVRFGENIRAFVEGKNAISTDRDLPGGRRTLDVDTLDLQQGFIDLDFAMGDAGNLTVRGGRQALLFGKQRLVSPLAWSNTLRSWDGISGIFDTGPWTIQGFWTQFAPVQKYEFNDPDSQTQFWGVYANGPIGESAVNLDLYFLGLNGDDPSTFNGTTGDEDRYTLGGRLSGKFGESGFDYDFEGAYQFGEVGSGDVDAFMIGSQLGYRPQSLQWGPRFFVGFDYGSGDDSPGGDVETFNHLFPLGHAYLGYIDIVGRQNIIDLSVGATMKPLDKMTLGATGHFFWRDSTDDALYNAGGGVVRPGAAGSDDEVGQEIDLTLKYAFDRHLAALIGYSHFFPGDFIDESGASDDIDFFYVQLQYTF